MTRWEYQTITFDFSGWFTRAGNVDGQAIAETLNKVGADGWELVSMFDTNRTDGATRFVVAVLKRPLT